jgi:hypothetical protein
MAIGNIKYICSTALRSCFETILIPNLEVLNKNPRRASRARIEHVVWSNWRDLPIVSSRERNSPAGLHEIKFCTSWRLGDWDRSDCIHTHFSAPVCYPVCCSMCISAIHRDHLLRMVGPSSAQPEIESFCASSGLIVKLDSSLWVFLTISFSSISLCHITLSIETGFSSGN